MDPSIFGLRFQSNAVIQPSAEELRAFLRLPKEDGRGRHEDDLAKYLRCLVAVKAFERARQDGAPLRDFKERIVFGALEHSRFFKPALPAAVEQYKYHYHKLRALDLKKPQAFIRSAEEEVSRLNPRKKEDQVKIGRLRGLIDLRNRDVKALDRRWAELAEELTHIAAYVRDNLVKIQKRCESSITLLVGLHLTGEKKNKLIEDIKTYFKEQIRGHLKMGPVTKQYVETLKQDVANLSRQLSQYVLEDVYSVTRMYEEVHDYAAANAARFDEVIRRINDSHREDLEEDKALFGRVDALLAALVSEFQFDISRGAEMAAETEHDKILFEKRAEMLDHLFELLEQGLTDAGKMDRDLFFQ
jgi:hypothetical protein